MESPSDGGRHSFPLSALFVLVAACGVVAALVTPVVRAVVDGTVGLPETVGASVMGALALMLLGAVVGLYHYRQIRGALWGILTGGLIGMVVGPVVLAPANSFPALMSVSAVGALVLLLLGAGLRFSQRR